MPDPTPEQISQAVAEVTKPADFPGEFKLGDGTVVKAANWEEAFQKVAQMKVDTATALRDREEQIRTLQAPPPPVETQKEGFDQKKYWELANVDPRAATRYALASDLGVDPEQLPQMFNEMRNVSVQSADQMEINRFMQNNPDYPGTLEVSSLLMDILANENRPLNSENLEYVYLRAVRDGLIEPIGEAGQQPFIPPSVQGGVSHSGGPVTMSQLNSLTDEQYEDFLRKTGLLKDGGKQEGVRI